jgi:uncharacterized protein (DUF2252 family)
MTSNTTTRRTAGLPSPRPSGPAGRPGPEQRAAAGKAARDRAPLGSHAGLDLGSSRDPVGLLLGQAASRVPELVPVRHGRMLVSPFTYFRGAALPMAADLARTPDTGLRVQLCGDAHLANFGAFASPERNLVFDLNDFDETLPGPFEWDVKRLVASLAVAGRDNDFGRKDRRKVVLAGAAAYRTAMREFATMSMLDVWYAHLNVEQAIARVKDQVKKGRLESTQALIAKAHTRDSTQALAKLTTEVDGQRRITGDPPLIVPVEDLFPALESEALYAELRGLITKYSKSLQPNRRHLIQQFDFVHMARKVVGVGSVGTRAWILLMQADDGTGPLFLQAKEAQVSVLADYAGRSRYTNQGERVVEGQVLMQAVSDIFLGWQRATGADGVERDFYIRQLRDWKLSVPIETLAPAGMAAYAGLCGWTLARAHARSGDRIAIAAYLGRSEKFDAAMAEFAESYADLNERDYAALADVVTTGRAEAVSGL